MHDDLIDVAARRGRAWALAGVPFAASGPAVFLGVVVGLIADHRTGVVAGVIGGVVLSVLAALWLLAGAPGMPSGAIPKRGLRPADQEVVHIAEGIGLASGSLPAAAWQFDHGQPNVAAIEQGDRDALLVTTAALHALSRDELEAVCAAQLAIGHDGTCQRLEGMLTAWRVLRASTFLVGFPATVCIGFFPPLFGPIAAVVVPGELAAWLICGRLRWWTRVAADGVCVATTRHPEPLVGALRTLALAGGSSVPVPWLARISGAGMTRWAIPPTMPWTMTTTVNGRTTDQRTAEQVEDVNLLVRAGLVRTVCLEGAERTVASRSAVVDAVRRAGRAAAMGGAAEVEGVLVGINGAVGMAPPAGTPAGWYPDPQAPGMLRWWDGRAWTTNQTVLPR